MNTHHTDQFKHVPNPHQDEMRKPAVMTKEQKQRITEDMKPQHTDSVEITEKTLIKFIIDAVWEATDGGQKMTPEQFYFQEELNGEVDRILTTLQATHQQQVEEAVRKRDGEILAYCDEQIGHEIGLGGKNSNKQVIETYEYIKEFITTNHQD